MGYHDEDVVMEAIVLEEGCTTPRRQENQFPVMLLPPEPPKKRRYEYRGKKQPPKRGFFNPPDLELLFVMPTRRDQACV